jgi:DNA (cytosine-5)-methyltransferase 1
MRTLRTLCSGGELFGVGARAAGYTHVDGYEIDPKIAAVAQRNGFDVRAADVCEVDYEALPAVDHLHISPSCKNASQANQKGKDESGEPLPRETAGDLAVADASCRAIHAHQGATFTLENVWGYRSFESFDRIRAALADAGFSYEYWHLNSADYGVPQTRKRLILIARRGLWRIQRPHPTHRNGGDMFHARWRGWYAAIEDILHTLPPTKPAPWQLARLPKELTKTIIVHRNDMRSMPTRSTDRKPQKAGFIQSRGMTSMS